MNRYALKGNCKNRDEAYPELDRIINDHGFLVAFEKYPDESLDLMLEMNEIQMASLLSNLQKHLNFTDTKILECNPEKTCNIHLHLDFSY